MISVSITAIHNTHPHFWRLCSFFNKRLWFVSKYK